MEPFKLLVTNNPQPLEKEVYWDKDTISDNYIGETIARLGMDVEVIRIHVPGDVAHYLTQNYVDGLVIPVSHGDQNMIQNIESKLPEEATNTIDNLKKMGRVFQSWKKVPDYRDNFSPFYFGVDQLSIRAKRAHKPFEYWIENLYEKKLMKSLFEK